MGTGKLNGGGFLEIRWYVARAASRHARTVVGALEIRGHAEQHKCIIQAEAPRGAARGGTHTLLRLRYFQEIKLACGARASYEV